MRRGHILAIDIGLTNCKTVLFSHAGAMISRASVPYPTTTPGPGWVEQDPEDWWDGAVRGVRALRDSAKDALDSVTAISVTGHMHSLVCLGPEGSALGRALVLGDQRGIAEAKQISDEVGMERIYRLTGARMDASMPLAKIAWLRRNVPEIHAHARAFLSCKDWVRHRLTGDVSTDPIDACGTSLYDIQQRDWSPELMIIAGIRAEQLPHVADPCEIAGDLDATAATALGLAAGIPVVVGGGDDVEVLGNGLMGPGASVEHLGTTGSILTCADHPVYDPQMSIELYPHPSPDLWVLGGSVTAAGSALAWADGVLRPPTTNRAGITAQSAPLHPTQPLVFVPHLSGERCPAWEPHGRGSWIGLAATHTTDDLRQAVLEGVVFSLKRVLDRLEALVGPQQQITVSGREGDDEGWVNLRANVYNRPLGLLTSPEPTALGAMMLATVGIGVYNGLDEAVACVTGVERLIEPDSALARDYARLYHRYCTASEATGALLRRWTVELPDGRAT
ncbi:MAG: hypothetical protein GX620_11155 [Chloroflexi bacterium]|nr:hypothetical protein [Chloroflexota bacterium]